MDRAREMARNALHLGVHRWFAIARSHYENIDLATMSQGFAPGYSEAELDEIEETRHPWSLVMERKLLSMFMIPCFLCGYGYRQILSNTDQESDREKH